MTTYFAKQLFDGSTLHKSVLFSVEAGLISKLQANTNESDSKAVDVPLDGLVTAGFIDTQVNGGGGVLFNYQQDLEALTTMALAHARYGTTSMLPTLITDKLDTMLAAANGIAQAMTLAQSSIVGIHFEGPHLSLAKKGIHSQEYVRSISDAELAIFMRQDIGKVMLTVAPENLPCDVISDLVAQGIVISLGHSAAKLDTVLAAIDAGATGFTHLYNAMSGLSAREPGMIAAALSDTRTTSGLIVDLHHVSAYNCELAYKCIGAQRLMLVTDAMAHAGSELHTLPWSNSTITRHLDKLTLDDGSLAGSCLDMASAVRNMYSILRKKTDSESLLQEVLNMASKVPAKFLNLKNKGELKVGHQANFVLLDDQQNIRGSWINGLFFA